MNLRLQFIVLILSVIFMPIIIMGISFMLFNMIIYPSDPKVVADDFFARVEDMNSGDEIVELSNSLEDSYFTIIVDSSDIQSTKAFVESDRLNPIIIVDSRQHVFPDRSELYIILGVHIFSENTKIFPLIFMLSIIIPLLLLPILILRSINSSINILEKATSRIANGDLDFKLEVKRNDKLGSLSDSLDSMRQQIKLEQDRRNRFYMGISHDLMTPLAHISGYSDALLEGLSLNDEMTSKYLRIINNKSYQMEQRITQLLNYLSSTNLDFQQGLEKQNILVFLTDFLELHEEEQSFYKRTLQWSTDLSEKRLVPYNEELFTRALENLIQNSFKYGLEGEAVRVKVFEKEKNILIKVINKGIPIPPETVEHIFEPFFRGDKTRKGNGFGLGLSSVKSIIESHGWYISVQSSELETVFCIKIPI